MYRVSKCPRENTVITTVFTYWVSIIPYSSLPKISTKSPGVKHNCSALPLMIWKLILIYNSIPWFVKTLPNVWDRGAWWAAVYGITQGWTQLKWLSRSSIQINIQVSQLWTQNPLLVLIRKTYWLSCLGEALCQALTIHKNPCLLLKSLYPY